MILFLFIALLATITLVLRMLLREARGGKSSIPTWAVVGVAAALGSTGIGYGVLVKHLERGTPVEETSRHRDGSEGVLTRCEKAPAFEAEGWLNGRPPAPGDAGAQVIVVDLWALW
jgi:hypothetical protein